jgi:hypothetical protein
MGLSFTIAAGPHQRSHSRVRVPWDSWQHFTVSDFRFPQPGGPGPIFISPTNRVIRLYPLVLDSLSVASYESQGYDGGIRTRLHTRVSARITLTLAVYRQSVRLGAKPLETHDQYFFFQLNTCCYSPYVTSPLTTGWVCGLQLVLGLARAVILGSKSRWTHDHILLSQIPDFPNLKDQVPYLYPHEQGDPVIPPGTGFSFRRLLRLAGLVWGIRPFRSQRILSHPVDRRPLPVPKMCLGNLTVVY